MLLASHWSRQEVALMVYFASRWIRPETLHYLLLRRGFDHSTSAIEHKVVTIAQKYPYLMSQSGWNLEVVDRMD
jgi:hypothetical protein